MRTSRRRPATDPFALVVRETVIIHAVLATAAAILGVCDVVCFRRRWIIATVPSLLLSDLSDLVVCLIRSARDTNVSRLELLTNGASLTLANEYSGIPPILLGLDIEMFRRRFGTGREALPCAKGSRPYAEHQRRLEH